MHRAARNDARRLDVDALALGRLDRALAVDRIAERVDDAAEQALADRHVDDGAGALDRVAFLDVAVVAEDDDADVVVLEVERHAADAARKLDHLAGLDVVEAVDAGDAVTDREHLADFGDFRFLAEILDLLLEDRGDFCGADIHQPTSFMASLSELSLVRSDPSIMRLPTLTMRPPISDGSTCETKRDVLAERGLERRLQLGDCASRTAARRWSLRAATSPRCLAASRWKPVMHSGTANRRRLAAVTLTKLATRPPISALSRTAATARL